MEQLASPFHARPIGLCTQTASLATADHLDCYLQHISNAVPKSWSQEPSLRKRTLDSSISQDCQQHHWAVPASSWKPTHLGNLLAWRQTETIASLGHLLLLGQNYLPHRILHEPQLQSIWISLDIHSHIRSDRIQHLLHGNSRLDIKTVCTFNTRINHWPNFIPNAILMLHQ